MFVKIGPPGAVLAALFIVSSIEGESQNFALDLVTGAALFRLDFFSAALHSVWLCNCLLSQQSEKDKTTEQ